MKRHVKRAAVGVWMIGLLGACGDPNVPANQAAPPATEAAAEVVPTTSMPEAEVTEVSDSTLDVGVEDVIATDIVTDEPVATVGPLGGVTIDDPFPAQGDATTDPAVADAAVRYAFQHWILIDLDRDLRAKLIENGEDNAQGLHDGLQAARGIAELARFTVDEVRFTDAEHADVSFRIQWGDGPSPYFPNAMSGEALFQNGSWRVGGTTLCILALGSGQACTGLDAERPVPAAAIQVFAVPGGYEWLGDPEFTGLVPVPGRGSWTRRTTMVDANGTPQVDERELWVTTEILVGASQMDAESMTLVLGSGRFGVPDGEPEMLGDRPVRILVDEIGAVMVIVRADDVVVRLSGQGMTAPQLRAIAGSIGSLAELPVGLAGAGVTDTGLIEGDITAATAAPAISG